MLEEELINRELIYQNAVSIGVDKTPAIQSEVNYQRVNIIASSMLNRSSDRFAVSDADLKKEFELRKGELGGKEFKARHILLENEADARAVITALDKGADFAKLAGSAAEITSAYDIQSGHGCIQLRLINEQITAFIRRVTNNFDGIITETHHIFQ